MIELKNEDRHTRNIAVLVDADENYDYCPIFDNGAALLSDTTMDYPMDADAIELMNEVKATTFCQDFDEQLDIAERLYGQHLKFRFGESEIVQLLDADRYYSDAIKGRVKDITLEQKRKYQYLFR